MDMMIRLAQFAEFETQCLLLRPFAYKDQADFYEIAGNPENLAFIFPTQVTPQESLTFMVHYFMKEPLGVWAIEEKKSSKLIGAIRLENMDFNSQHAEVGYFIHKDYWGRGLASEALKNLTFLAFQELHLRSLAIITHKENLASQRVAQKAGFRLVREYKGSDRYSKQVRRYCLFEMRKSGYRYE
ncbi:GNAT family N-acetyltransferase [Streptococcus caprae]|uniref:GNAT family N-acetyltransferase n=1 Tax=Streptococcus caprae TaxID=1640501 RepID=A0ABV8CT19_9STRE